MNALTCALHRLTTDQQLSLAGVIAAVVAILVPFLFYRWRRKASIRSAFAPFVSIAGELFKEAAEEAECLVDDQAKHNRYAYDFADTEVVARMLGDLEKVNVEPLPDQEAIRLAGVLVRTSSTMVRALLTTRAEVWARTDPTPSEYRVQDKASALRFLSTAEGALAQLIAHRDNLLSHRRRLVDFLKRKLAHRA